MRILIDITHPAHAHFFKNVISRFSARGHEVVIASRRKDITTQLLDAFGIKHRILSTAPEEKVLTGLAWEMVVHCWRLFLLARKTRPDIMLQVAGTFVAPVGFLLRIPTVVFYDTEMARMSNLISYRLATVVCTPECYEGSAGKNEVRYPGYQTLARLHPNRFAPDAKVLEEYGLRPDEKIFVVRFVALKALHDYRSEGISETDKVRIVQELSKYGKVLVSSEGRLPAEVEKYRSPVSYEKLHHVMAFAALMVGSSPTMASECAVLGVPAIYISSETRGFTNEQENRYGLVKTFTPGKREEYLRSIIEIANRPLQNIRSEYQAKRSRLLAERIDTTAWIEEFIESRFEKSDRKR